MKKIVARKRNEFEKRSGRGRQWLKEKWLRRDRLTLKSVDEKKGLAEKGQTKISCEVEDV